MTKYGAIPTVVDNITFASRAEARRYGELKLMQQVGEIKDLFVHPTWPIVINGYKVTTYAADFSYGDTLTGKLVVEDVKGVRTGVYKLKKRLLFACHGLVVTEIDA